MITLPYHTQDAAAFVPHSGGIGTGTQSVISVPQPLGMTGAWQELGIHAH